MRKWCLAIAVCLASGITQAAVFTKPAVTLVLPDGWVEVPAAALQVLYEDMKRQTPLGDVSQYDYAFQAKAGPPWLTYPYVLVKVRSTGRPTEGDLADLPAAAQKAGAPGRMRYDESTNIVWMTSQTAVANVGDVGSLSAFIPTARGFVDVHGYSPAADFPRLEPIFEKIASSAILAPDFAYRRAPPQPPGPGVNRIALLAVIGALIVLGVGFFRRRKS